jgi:O-antigen/teichoic acid export membrane protein
VDAFDERRPMVNNLFGLIVKILLIAIAVYMGLVILEALLSCGIGGILVICLIGCGVWYYLKEDKKTTTK